MKQVTILLLSLLLLLTAVGCDGPVTTYAKPNLVETIDGCEQIYAAAVREIHGIIPSYKVVYLVSTTEDLIYKDAPTTPSQQLPTALQDAISAELADEHYEVIWIEAYDDAPIDPAGGEIAAGDGMIITLGNIHSQEDDSVQLSFFMSCEELCGFGTTYVLSQEFGNWHISGSIGPQIAS